MNKLIISSVILIIACFLVVAQDDARAAWQVAGYDITANVLQSERALAAVTNVTMKNVGRGPGSGLTLRINSKAKIKSVSINGSSATFHSRPDTRPNLQRLDITLPSPISPNSSVTLNLDYRLPAETNTGLEAISPVGSQFRPESFWYPVLNTSYTVRGIDTAPFKIRIEGGNAISSGAEKDSGATYEQSLN